MKLSTVALFVAGMAIGAAGIYFLNPRHEASPAPVTTKQPARPARAASALGRIQPAGSVLTLGVPLPDRLDKLLVEEGDEVKEGMVLAVLGSRSDRQAELDLLDGQINEAGEKIKEIEHAGALQVALDELQAKQVEEQEPLDIAMQKLKVDFLKKQAEKSRETLVRVASLPSISRQEKDQQELLVLQSQAELDGAAELLQKLTQGHALNLKLSQAKMNLTRASLERSRKEVPLASLKQQRAMALYRLGQTSLKAPTKGKILKILARPGELVAAPQPILQMADLSQMIVLAEVYETDIHKVEMGQRVDITSKVENARKMTGKVVAVGSMIGKNRVYDADPLADVDRRVIEVRILLDQPEPASHLINHQVNVDFQSRPMKIQLTVLNLLNQKLRTAIALLGVAFATILIFMQLGFYGSAAVTATVFIEKLDFDLILLSPDYLDINRPGTFARARMTQANSIPGVESVVPLYVAGNLWRIVDLDGATPGLMNGRRRGIMVVGFNPADHPFKLPELEDQLNLIKVPSQVLIDTETRAYFKQRNVGLATDLGVTQVRIVGQFTIGSGYGADGIVLMSDRSFSFVFGGISLGRVNLGLIKLDSGANPEEVAAALQEQFQDTGIRVLSRSAMEEKERNYWLNKTAVGKIFTIGVLVALMVGTVFVYQVISSDITQRFAEYATLKAMGYGSGYLASVVLQQAELYGVLGYVPGFALTLVLYEWGSAATTLPITMDWQRALIVLMLSVLMCVVSGFFAVKKVRTADPADLF